jgi:hypothetical protein
MLKAEAKGTAKAKAKAKVEVRTIDGYEIRIVDGHAELPAGMTSVPAFAFGDWDGEGKGCKSLRSVTIPSSVKVIKEWAFRDCPLLTSVTVPSTASVASNAFLNSPTTVTKRTPEEMAAAEVSTSLAAATAARCLGCSSPSSPFCPLPARSRAVAPLGLSLARPALFPSAPPLRPRPTRQ